MDLGGGQRRGALKPSQHPRLISPGCPGWSSVPVSWLHSPRLPGGTHTIAFPGWGTPLHAECCGQQLEGAYCASAGPSTCQSLLAGPFCPGGLPHLYRFLLTYPQWWWPRGRDPSSLAGYWAARQSQPPFGRAQLRGTSAWLLVLAWRVGAACSWRKPGSGTLMACVSGRWDLGWSQGACSGGCGVDLPPGHPSPLAFARIIWVCRW